MRLYGLVVVLLSLAISGCGGGGSDDQPPYLPGRVVYVDVVDGKDHLYTADSDGRHRQEIVIGNLTILPAHEAGDGNLQISQIASLGMPNWSPDHTHVAVQVNRSDGRSQLIVVNILDGSAVTASSQLGQLEKYDPNTFLGSSRVRNFDWSPNGQFLLYRIVLPGDTNPRLMTTAVATGALTEVPESGDLITTAYSWDETSTGIYLCIVLPENVGTDLLHVDAVTGEKVYANQGGYFAIGMSISGTEIAVSFDPESNAMYVTDRRAGTAIFVATGPSNLLGWFLGSSKDLVAVERVTSGVRQPPQIARFVPSDVPSNRKYEHFSVKAPTALKWDFYPTT